MEQDKNMKDAVSSFVESLEEEQRKDKLIENSLKKETVALDGNISGMETIAKKLKKFIELICIGEDVNVGTDIKELKFSIQGGDLSIAIGRNGKNIAALEYIINLIGKRKKLIDYRVTIDIKDYRKNRINKIKKIAMEMADKAIKEGRKIALKPMCAYERKVIHNALAKFKKVTTKSMHEEPDRRIIIYPVREAK
jgi:spoIIIJ-associated protein